MRAALSYRAHADADVASGYRAAAVDENALLLRYAPLVKRAAAHLRSQISTVFAAEDFEQVGLLGLLEAIRRYGGPPDDEFESFAFKRIRGAMLDELRRQDWRPRQVRQAAHALNRSRRALYQQLGREPTDNELAAAMGIDSDAVRDLRYAQQAEELQSLEEWLANGGNATGADMSREELRLALKQALAQLKPRQQLLMTLYYVRELNMKEIAAVLDVTESRVCQLHKECIARLNQLLRDED
ncbi:MAG: FliA/WhiG family RNA polymerase sigma factor [Spongiibacteraceae bacterium]|jgi:RNA polymerase sigma factor for flagellar operon FliA|nr:FliA/WhiG family RNA polymerase sigma factor [Spongiibacteraceae bacterium]